MGELGRGCCMRDCAGVGEDELQRVPCAAEGVQRGVRAAAVPAVDRGRRGAGPRHRVRRQVLRPRGPHVLPHRRSRAAAPSGVPVAAVRGGREDDQSGERRGGAALGGELAPLRDGCPDRAARRRHPPAAGARGRRPGGRRRRERHVRLLSEVRRGVLHVLDGEAAVDDEEARVAGGPGSPGAIVRSRAVVQPRVAGGGGGGASDEAGRHAVDELRRLRDNDRRREGA